MSGLLLQVLVYDAASNEQQGFLLWVACKGWKPVTLSIPLEVAGPLGWVERLAPEPAAAGVVGPQQRRILERQRLANR
jgi:hypothetical protein